MTQSTTSLGTVKIAEEGTPVRRRAGASEDGGPQDLEQSPSRERDETKPTAEGSIIGYEDPIMLTQSTHSFLFTEPTCSVPFNFSILVIVISYTCLLLALFNNIGNSEPGNPLNVPVGVTVEVKIAQYLALLIGLIMEEEIPESLYLLRMISSSTLHKKEPTIKYSRFFFCGFIRIAMGYLFIFNMVRWFRLILGFESVNDYF